MKKFVLAVAAVVFTAGAALAAGESFINVKLGLDPIGNADINSFGLGGSKNTKIGFSLAGEYLYQSTDMFSIGGGVEYLLPRQFDVSDGPKLSYLPIYATVKVNPIETAKEVFFKANLGYVVLFDMSDVPGADKKGGMYYAIGAGYELPMGLTVDLFYSIYNTKLSYTGDFLGTPITVDVNCTYSKVGLNVGYKFKI